MCVGEVQGAVSDLDRKRNVLEDERKDIWGVCAECDDIWQRNVGFES